MIKKLLNKFKKPNCDFCGKDLYRFSSKEHPKSYGGVDVNLNISGSDKRTAYLCNLCYHLFKK